MEKYNILIVDDDEFLLDMYTLKFSQAGHTIQAVKGTQEVLSRLEDGYEPDAIIIDLVMPKMDGFELLKQLKERKLVPKAACIILSNQGEKEDLERARALGAVGYIVKANAIPSEVLVIVERMIEKRKNSTH